MIINFYRHEYCIRDITILDKTMLQYTIILLTSFKISKVIGRTRINYVISCNNGTFFNHTILLKKKIILEINTFFMVQKYHIIRSIINDLLFEFLDCSNMNLDSLGYSSMFLDTSSYICIIFIYLNCMNSSIGHYSTELQS
jgi:hypothetical protein